MTVLNLKYIWENMPHIAERLNNIETTLAEACIWLGRSSNGDIVCMCVSNDWFNAPLFVGRTYSVEPWFDLFQ